MTRSTSYIRIVLAVLPMAALLTAVSCRREWFEGPAPMTGDDISLVVKEARTLQTKGMEPYMELVLSKDSVDLYLEVHECDMPVKACRDMTVTKGASYSGNDIGKFNVTAFLDTDADNPYFDLELNSDGSPVGTGYYWPITVPATTVSFFGYARNRNDGMLSDLTYDPEGMAGSFSYVLPNPSGDMTSAVEQPDLLFAIAPNQENTGSPVEMNFYHALSAIVFKVGDIPADFIVEKVEFTNIPSAGSCEYVRDEDGNLTFDWTNSDPESFVQEFGKQMSDTDGNIADVSVSSADQTFMMIPCALPDDAELVITVAFDKGETELNTTYVIRKDMKSLMAAWVAGKQYTYKISSPEEIEVAVDDKLTENRTKKEELEITNTGLATSYMRALLVGYWVVPGADEEEDVIVGQWRQSAVNEDNPDDDGVFEPAADFDSNWIIGSDGYYYCKHPVASGETIPELFTSYTVTGNPPVVAAELILSIAVQAVRDSKIDETGWPVERGSDGKTLQKKS